MDPERILSCPACGSASGLNQHGFVLQCEDCGTVLEQGLQPPREIPSSREGWILDHDAIFKRFLAA
jgi:uncharacterized Zn finger protein